MAIILPRSDSIFGPHRYHSRRILIVVAALFALIIFNRTAFTDVLNGLPPSLLAAKTNDARAPPRLRPDPEKQAGLAEIRQPKTTTPAASSQSLCRTLPGAEDVVVVMKTGGTEAFARIPEQLLTLSHCVPKFMVFSDLEQNIGGFHIYDAVKEVSDYYKDTHEDFHFYRALNKAHKEHLDVTELDNGDKAWALDKWKNIPMLHTTYLEHPEAKWYIFLDADTYLSWNNLLYVLNSLDPDFPYYMGSIYFMGNTPFAQGGTGYILSREAVRRFEATRNDEYLQKWENETATCCCGDVMLSVAMHDSAVNVSGTHPLFVTTGPGVLDWGDWLFCEPSVTWHHVKSYDVEGLFNFEQKWLEDTVGKGDAPKPYLYKDLFEQYVRPHLSDLKEDWDNLSHDRVFTQPSEDHPKENNDWDWLEDEKKQEMWDGWSEEQKKSVESVENCRLLCEEDRGCRQWLWRPGSCTHSWSVRLGHSTAPGNQTVSGWFLDRLMGFKETGEPGEMKWKPEQGI